MKKTTQKAPRSRGAWLRLGTLLFLILLSCALVYQHRFNRSSAVQSPTPAPSVVDVQAERSLRETAYDKDIASLERLLESGAADADTQSQAVTMNLMLSYLMVRARIESLSSREVHGYLMD